MTHNKKRHYQVVRVHEDHNQAVKQGHIEGHSRFIMTARNRDASTTALTVWPEPGKYTYPVSASFFTLSSDSANDTVSGTGCRSVVVSGLTSGYSETSFTLTTNGLTPVTATTALIRVNGLQGDLAGASETNSGNIYLGAGTVTAGKPETVYSEIVAGDGVAQMGVYTVPVSKTANYVNAIYSVDSGKSAVVSIRTRTSVTACWLRSGKFNAKDAGNQVAIMLAPPIPAGSDVEILGTGGTGKTDLSVFLEFHLVKNDAY